VENKAPRGNYRGTGRFTTSERPLRRIVIACEASTSYWPHGRERRNVGVFFPRHRCDRASDTPVAIYAFLTLVPPSRDSSEITETAETTADADS
jgi:hypothetical protein